MTKNLAMKKFLKLIRFKKTSNFSSSLETVARHSKKPEECKKIIILRSLELYIGAAFGLDPSEKELRILIVAFCERLLGTGPQIQDFLKYGIKESDRCDSFDKAAFDLMETLLDLADANDDNDDAIIAIKTFNIELLTSLTYFCRGFSDEPNGFYEMFLVGIGRVLQISEHGIRQIISTPFPLSK